MEKVDTHGLRLVLCAGANPDPKYLKEYHQIYDCWSSVWRTTLEEVGSKGKLYADVFLAQDHLLSVFIGDRCVAMCGLRWHWGDRSMFTEDEYFSQWSPEAREKLLTRGNLLLVCGAFAVRSDVRRDQLAVPVKDMLSGLAVRAYEDSRADAMAGAVRIDRGMTRACVEWGAEVLEARVNWALSKDNTDLIALFRDKTMPQEAGHPLAALVRQLWEERLEIRRDGSLYEFLRQARSLEAA